MNTRVGKICASITTTLVAFALNALGPTASQASPSSEADCLECAPGQEAGCPEDFHKAANGNPEWHRGVGSHPSTCYSGTCSEKHGVCWIEGEELLERILSAADSFDMGAIAELFAKHPSRLSFNRERQGIQVGGCNGEMIAHLPASSALAQGLRLHGAIP